MKAKEILILLEEMSHTKHPISAEECSRLLDMSVSAIKSEIHDVRPLLKNHGCNIIGKSGLGNGYELIIQDHEKFDTYIHNTLLQEQTEERNDFNNQDNRISYIIRMILNAEEYLKSEDIADSMAISKSQFGKDLLQVKKYLEQYDVCLISKSHYGIKAQADERQIRLCLAGLEEIYSRKETESNIIAQLKSIVVENAEHFRYGLNDHMVDCLVMHLYIAIRRIKEKHTISFSDDMYIQHLEEREKMLARCIAETIEKKMHVKMEKEELYYIAMHLSAKEILTDDNQVGSEILELVEEILVRIREQYNIDLHNNLNLKMVLGLHTVPLLRRIEFHMNLKNPLLDEIKKNLYMAYEMAICGCEVINQKYHCKLSEDEIGYYALHLKVAMDEQYPKNKKRVLVVCSSGRGSAYFLKYDFQKRFESEIEKIDVCNVFELNEKKLSEYDCIFTTVSIPYKMPIPVFTIKQFMDGESQKMISRVLHNSSEKSFFETYFKKDLFFGDISETTKEAVLQRIVTETKKRRDLPDGLYEAVIRREKLGNTQFGKYVAMPHPDGIIGDKSVISIGVLKTPVEWGEGKVQIVIFMCLAKEFGKNNERLFKVIAEFVENKKEVGKLISGPTYENLKKIIEKIDGEDERIW